MKQTTMTNQDFSTRDNHETGASLAELFAGRTLANSGAPAIPALEIVHYDHDNKRSSSDVLARRCRLAMVDLNEAERLRPQVEALLDQEGVAAGSPSPINHQLHP